MNDENGRLPLETLDPGRSDPGFWVRFHLRVMERARGELARRRLEAEPTIPEIVFAWRRTLIPAVLMAAALAAILLVGDPEPVGAPFPLALEEVLLEDLAQEPIPTVLGREAELDEVAFLAGMERF